MKNCWRRPRFWFGVLAIAAMSAGLIPANAADAVANFYSGKTVTIFVGSPPGGTYDLYARNIARYLGKYIPGNPRVIVENMPGAASYTAAAHVFSVAQQDGLSIGALAAAIPYQTLIDPSAPPLDVQHVNWLSSVSTFTVVMAVNSKLPIYNIDDLRKRPTIMATLSPGQLPSLLVAATNATLGTKIKAINGHPSMNDALLAVQRGELDGYPGIPVDSLRRMSTKQRNGLRVILQYGPKPSPDYPNAAYAVDLTKTPEDHLLLDLAQAPLKIGYIYMTGPSVSVERLQALRAAMSLTYKDPGFLKDAEKQVLNVEPLSGEEVQKNIAEIYATPKSVVDRMRALYRRLSR